jgi:hypothetical protein
MTPGTVSGQDFRMVIGRVLGPQLVKSTAFEVSHRRGMYTFRGQGYGHGVGLCVIGAMRRASAGASREKVLAAYFPGLRVSDFRTLALSMPAASPPGEAAQGLGSGDARAVTPTDRASASPANSMPAAPATAARGGTAVDLRLPPADSGERGQLVELLDRLISEASGRVNRDAPSRLTVIVHASVDAFRRATGQPWWSDTLSRGDQVDVQPLAVLRQRSGVEGALARAVGHILTAPVMAGHPMWTQEGAALYAGGLLGPSEVAAARSAARGPVCPTDAEIARPSSVDAARAALARARQCFATALARGQRWHEVSGATMPVKRQPQEHPR